MVKRRYIVILMVALCEFYSSYLYSQETDVLPQTIISQPQSTASQDTIIQKIELKEADMENIKGIRKQFELQNSTYSIPFQPNDKLLRFLKKDELEISNEALYWLNKIYEAPSNISWQDITPSPLFLPLVFKGNHLQDTILYDFFWKNVKTAYSDLFRPDTSLFQNELKKRKFEKEVLLYMERNHPEYFKYIASNLPTENEIPKPDEIKTNPFTELFTVESEMDASTVGTPKKYRPKIRYWRPYHESSIQFSQSHISENWHKGGTGNLNLFMRTYMRYNYNKDKIQFNNELEWKASFYTAPKDTVHDYRVGEDVFRLYSNFGYKAFNKWYYTVDANFRTQLFTTYAENSKQKLAAFLAPYTLTIGVGMKYELRKNFKQPGRNLSVTVNMAPLSYTYMYSINDKIDLGRHGFINGKHYLSKVGSTVRADATYNFNRVISWQSNFYYNTSYDRIEGELQNTLNFAINRYFSTRFYLDLRFDDGVKKKKDSDSYLQVYEILSFGFNYKW
ncbi:DUF3078 domain-containing protein [Parabacteroides pacaensis]|uniref:DUF3078 domain-containing protein n=1 Tax=Parabacteroides pacaensis TaxID=2086575 RepID=UPI001F2F067F|nr:DUF3078 domain-containing protein [Parabacteroides pacaensis]